MAGIIHLVYNWREEWKAVSTEKENVVPCRGNKNSELDKGEKQRQENLVWWLWGGDFQI